MTGKIHILGPQRPSPNLPNIIERHLPDGPLAVITAGWRIDEIDISALERDLNRPLYLLPLYGWFDRLGAKEPELASLHSERQIKIKSYKKVYNLQLRAAFDLWTKIAELAEENPELYSMDEKDALAAVRITDRRAIERQDLIRKEFDQLNTPWTHTVTMPYHDKIKNTLKKCRGLIIAGGHVAVLRNRLFFFGRDKLLPECIADGKTMFAW